jgi:glycosyltransferase involved in cell wall biosynthesis
MDEKIRISAVVITFNEERNIELCLKSLKMVADEILVVDSFSTDQTESICRNNQVRFIQNKFEGHIQQKNFAIHQAKYDYVLALDADEVLSDKLIESILKVKNHWHDNAYSFNRLTNYCGKWIRHCGWYPDTKIRLWDKRKGKWEGRNPHDKVEMTPGIKVSFLKGDLLHYSYHNLKQHIEQVNYFTEIMAKEAYGQNKNTNIFLIIFSPFFKFFKSYFLKLGILDGYHGFLVCIISAHATFLKHTKLKELYKLRS